MKIIRPLWVLLAVCFAASHSQGKDITVENLPPVVVSTIPQSGALDVDTALTELKVTFSKRMLDGSWSCVNLSKESFPGVTGSPRFETDGRTFVLPVKLETGKTYAMWLNSDKDRSFMDTQRIPAVQYLLVFQTKK